MDPYSRAPARVRTLTSVQLPRPSVLIQQFALRLDQASFSLELRT
jgi:hypothetical protein